MKDVRAHFLIGITGIGTKVIEPSSPTKPLRAISVSAWNWAKEGSSNKKSGNYFGDSDFILNFAAEFLKSRKMKGNVLTAPSPASAKYWSELANLSNDVKLELISLLSASIRLHIDEDWTEGFAGKWQDDRTTEEIIDDIHEARNAKMKEIVL